MKKIHIVALLMTHTIATSCMELELRCRKQTPKHQSVISTNTPLDNKSAQQKRDLMERLYNDAYKFIDDVHCNSNPCNNELFFNYLTLLVKDMHNAHDAGINEDMMADFTYNKWLNSYSILFTPVSVPVIFNCLKRYRLNTHARKEELPTISDYSKLIYPNYFLLASSVSTLWYHPYEDIKFLADCLYSSTNILFKNCSQGSYNNLKDDFYTKAYYLLRYPSPDIKTLYARIYDLLKIIDRAKQLNEICSKQDLGYKFLDEPAVDSLFSSFKSQTTKNVISYFCLLVQEYNTNRGNKITPTDKQYDCYQIQHSIGIALPDYVDNTLFNEETYAFKEFAILINDLYSAANYCPAKIEKQIAQCYSQRK